MTMTTDSTQEFQAAREIINPHDLPPPADPSITLVMASPIPAEDEPRITYAIGHEADGEHLKPPFEPFAPENRARVLQLLELAADPDHGFIADPANLGSVIFALVKEGLLRIAPKGEGFRLTKTDEAATILALNDTLRAQRGLPHFSGEIFPSGSPASRFPPPRIDRARHIGPSDLAAVTLSPEEADRLAEEQYQALLQGPAFAKPPTIPAPPDFTDAGISSVDALLADALGALNAIDDSLMMGASRIGNEIDRTRDVLETLAENTGRIAKALEGLVTLVQAAKDEAAGEK